MADDRIFIADRITKRRFRSGNAQYYVKWKGCPSSYNTWEPERNILDPGLILEFEARLADASSKGKKPGRKPKLLKLKTVDFKGRCHDNGRKLVSGTNKAKLFQSSKSVQKEEEHNTENTTFEEREDDSRNNHLPNAELDINNNATIDATSRNEKWKIPRKPKSLFLEQSMKDTTTTGFPSNPSSFGVFEKADSPLMGMVPSPTYGLSFEQDCAKYTKTCDYVVTAQAGLGGNGVTVGGNLKEPSNIDINRRSPTSDGNSVKLGKFALLRKYRNSLEESDPVTTTDVTVEGVTVTVKESDNPQGFFSPTLQAHWNVT